MHKSRQFGGIIAFSEDSLQMINFHMKCLEITTYAKTPIK